MTRPEVAQILSRLKANQASFVINLEVAKLWEEEFAKDAFVDVHRAVSAFIRSNTENYPVSIAKIRAFMSTPRNMQTATRAYDIVVEDDKEVVKKIRYSLNKWGEIIDDEGRIWSHPDPNIQRQLVARVASTGMILTETEAAREKEYLEKKLK